MSVVRARPGLHPPLLALTFDDGPGEQTPALLDLLSAHDAKATFFVIGRHVEGGEEVVARAIAEGHELGNHTYGHHHPVDLDDDELRHEIVRCQRLLGAAPPRLFRPPYGEDALRCGRIAAERGIPECVLWSVDPCDWLERDPDAIAEVILAGAEPGAIIDLHDAWPAGTSTVPDRTPTLRALARVLPELASRGLRCRTISELLAA